MAQFTYKAHDQNGNQVSGQREANSATTLKTDLIKEGLSPIEIKALSSIGPMLDKLNDRLRGKTLFLDEISIFIRQMQVLYQAGVPINVALRQLSNYTRSRRLAYALKGILMEVEQGHELSTSMRTYPDVFSPLMIDIIQIGENSGKLDEAFGHLHKYLEFEAKNARQLKTVFRYPMFLGITIIAAMLLFNIFIIPTFAQLYESINIKLPWQTRLIIGTSDFIINRWPYIIITLFIITLSFSLYLKSPEGRLQWDRFKLSIPVIGPFVRRLALIRFSQSMAIVTDSGLPIIKGLDIVKNIIQNTYIKKQIEEAEENIKHGNKFTASISKIVLFTPMELQIIDVGESNGKFGEALKYISDFHGQEIEYDLKKLNDMIGPILIGIMSVFILILALAIYLPIWNLVAIAKAG